MINSIICILACNKYPSSPLSGCIDDAHALYEMCRSHGWEGPARIQFDDQVKNEDVREAVNWFVDEVNTKKYTNALLCVSGHGTSIPSRGRGDPTMEVFCPVDIDKNWNNRDLVCDAFFEERLNSIDKSLKGKVKVDFLALCCNSGGLTSTQIDDAAEAVLDDPSTKVRYLRNPWENDIAIAREFSDPVSKEFNRLKKNVFVDDESVWCYRSACNSSQYSYEINSPIYGRGDLSRIALVNVLKKYSDISWEDAHKATQQFIDTKYKLDQCPQLWAPTWRLKSDIFSAPSV